MTAPSTKSNILADGWFREESDMWPGIAQGLKIDRVLYDQQTEFQHLSVFETDPRGPWGTVMALDGCVQFTDYDEFTYHEMLGHLSCCSHAKPKRVLVIGGGDGGVVREVLKHKTRAHGNDNNIDAENDLIQSVELVDIDGAVIEQSKIHFPQIACAFDDPCVTATVGDGVDFVCNKAKDNTYDVIIVDTTDPEGPASSLFGETFYKNVLRILTPHGVVCNQGESIWLHRPLIEKMMAFLAGPTVGFEEVRYALIQIPTYPGGSIGTLVCRKSAPPPSEDNSNKKSTVMEPLRPVESLPFAGDLKYYTSEVHRAAFVLPKFVQHLNEQ